MRNKPFRRINAVTQSPVLCNLDSNSMVGTTVSSTIVLFWGGGFSCRRRDLSLCLQEKSRFLPLYYSYHGLVREARGNHCHTLIKHQAHPRSCHRRPPPPLSLLTAAVVVNGSHISWQCRRGLPHSGGKACQYFWWPGPSSNEDAFVCEGRPAGARWRSVDDRSLPPSQ